MKIFLFVIVILTSCNFSDQTRTLSNNWIFVDEGHTDKAIDGGSLHIPCEILSYGYDENFIIASQKPTEDCFLGKDTFNYKNGTDKIYFWLLIHKSKKLLGPLTENEYLEARSKYQVPASLKLNKIY